MIGPTTEARMGGNDLLVVIGGTLVCAGGLVLSRAPEVREGVRRLASTPQFTQFGRLMLAGAAYQVGGALQRWGDGTRLGGTAG